MELLGYGEDALTLWAVTHRLDELLRKLGDPSEIQQCQVLFRPSFGRRGGTARSEFGEFDFIVLTKQAILLGESKWHRSSEKIIDGELKLRGEQALRHDIMRFYINHFAFKSYDDWDKFTRDKVTEFSRMGHGKTLAPASSLLANNLQQALYIIRKHFHSPPQIIDVLLYLHGNSKGSILPSKGPKKFRLVLLDYSAGLKEKEGNMISIAI
jgi:hypothetical protein